MSKKLNMKQVATDYDLFYCYVNNFLYRKERYFFKGRKQPPRHFKHLRNIIQRMEGNEEIEGDDVYKKFQNWLNKIWTLRDHWILENWIAPNMLDSKFEEINRKLQILQQ